MRLLYMTLTNLYMTLALWAAVRRRELRISLIKPGDLTAELADSMSMAEWLIVADSSAAINDLKANGAPSTSTVDTETAGQHAAAMAANGQGQYL